MKDIDVASHRKLVESIVWGYLIKGFHDEALSGEWRGCRSSRLGLQWRLIYRVVSEEFLFQVASITAHDYRRP